MSITAQEPYEILIPREPFPEDDVFVLSYTSAMRQQEVGLPSQEMSQLSLWAAQAAYEMLNTNPGARVFIAGERTFGKAGDSTATLMANYLEKRGIPANQVFPVTSERPLDLRDTPSQIAALQRQIGEYSGRIMLIGFGYHLDRAADHAAGYGFSVIPAPAEDILMNEKGYKGVLPDLDALAHFENWQEKLARWISHYDKKGRIIRLFSLIQGPRYQDVTVHPDGTQTPVSTTARSYIRKNRLKRALKSLR